jgi:hypothetical protein
MFDLVMQHTEELTAFFEPACGVLPLRVHRLVQLASPSTTMNRQRPSRSGTGMPSTLAAPRHGAPELPRCQP